MNKTKQIKRKYLIWASITLIVIAAYIAVEPFIERFGLKLLAQKLPEVAKIYEVESASFPNYKIGTLKRWSETEPGTQISFSVTLSSTHPILEAEAYRAGKIACGTGLAEGTIVSVTIQRQYWPLALYDKNTVVGYCNDAIWKAGDMATEPTPQIIHNCSNSDIDLTTASGGNTHAGSYIWLVYTNKTNEPCSLQNAPLVKMVSSLGIVLREATTDAKIGSANESVSIAPKQQAYSYLQFTYPDVPPGTPARN